jgi:hypothetical protein
MISLRNQNANESDVAEDDIQEGDQMGELEEDSDDDDDLHHPRHSIDVRYIYNLLYDHYMIKHTTGCSHQDQFCEKTTQEIDKTPDRCSGD